MRIAYWIAAVLLASSSGIAFADQDLPRHNLPASADGNLVLGLCDGETSVEVPGVKAGRR